MPENLVPMKMTKTEVKAKTAVGPVDDAPRFPWGLRINLEEEELTKLDVTELPKVGVTDILHAEFTVVSVSENDSNSGGKNRSVSLQITALQLGESPTSDAAGTLYGGGKK